MADNATTRREAPLTAGIFDVGKVTKDLQESFKIFGTRPPSVQNSATPEGLAVLLASLAKLTDATIAKRNEVGLSATTGDQWDATMGKWATRMENYQRLVAAAPPGDRESILWDVTAPLLVGYFGGEGTKLPQQTLDAYTPFALANGITTADAWREEQWELFKQDMVDGLKNLPGQILPWWVWGIAGLAGAAFIVSIARGRR